MADLLQKYGIPEELRWYAKRCSELKVACSRFMGWTVLTRPFSIDASSCAYGRIFSVSELYVPNSCNLQEVVSEREIYINADLERVAKTVFVAPYISIRSGASSDVDNLIASNYVLYFCIPDIVNRVDASFHVSYISDIAPELALPGSKIYGRPKYRIRGGELYAEDEGGYNRYHMMALGILRKAEVLEICRCNADLSGKMDIRKCVKTPPNPNIWPYPKEIPGFSYSDMIIFLKNKNVEEICASIKKPFMYFYPEADYSSNSLICEIVQNTQKAIGGQKGRT